MTDNKPFIFYAKGIEAKSFYDEKAEKTRYFVEGHVASEDLDLVNDIVTKGCMQDLSQQFKSRSIKLDFDHETLRKAEGETDFDAQLNLTKIPLGVAVSENLDAKGNKVSFELNPNWKKMSKSGEVVMTFNDIWENVKSGFYDAFSIAYVPIKTANKMVNDVKARLLDKVNLVNVALTGNPINPTATISNVMAKSLEYMKKSEDGVNMTENEYNSLISEVKSVKNDLTELKNLVGETMADEKDKQKATKSQENGAASNDAQGSQATDANDSQASNEGSNTGSEGKSNASEEKSKVDAKAFADLKSQVGQLAESVDKINQVLEKALPAGHGAEDKSQKPDNDNAATEAKSVGSNTLDLI